jgi:cyclopropane-fatty-acyl-phospholipid synthase
MGKISVGQLRVLTPEHIYTVPAESPTNGVDNEKQGPKAELRVVNDAFWVRLCSMGDLGFAEAYMYGDVECDDLVSLFRVRFLTPARAVVPSDLMVVAI